MLKQICLNCIETNDGRTLTVETEMNGDSKSTCESGPSLGLSCRYKRFLFCLGCSSRPSQKLFCPHLVENITLGYIPAAVLPTFLHNLHCT
jgi:hypothetical protein